MEQTLSTDDLLASHNTQAPSFNVREAMTALDQAQARLRALPGLIASAQGAVAAQERVLDAAAHRAIQAGKDPEVDVAAYAQLEAAKRRVVLLDRERGQLTSDMPHLVQRVKLTGEQHYFAGMRARIAKAESAVANLTDLVQQVLDLGVTGTLSGPKGLTVRVATGYGITNRASIVIELPLSQVKLPADIVDTCALQR